MSSGIASKLSLRQRTKDSASKIETLEQDLIKVVNGVNDVFGKFQTQLEAQKEVIAALTDLLTTPVAVSERVQQRRLDREASAAAEAKASVELLKTQGVLVTSEKVEEASFIVGREFDKEGSVKHPGRVQVTFKDLKPEFQPKLLGQSVGFLVETEEGGKFEIQEIYSIDEAAAAAAQKPTAPAENSAGA